VLRTPAFRFLLGSTLASSFGAAMTSVSVSWLVYHYTHSTIDIAFVGLAGIVPGIALGLIAGVIADRYNRRRVMVTSDVARMALMAVLASALYLTGFSLVLVIGVMTVVYSFSALFTPASQAILPRIVTTDQLEDANGFLAALTQGGSAVGAAVGGVAVALAGAVAGLGVNAATYALSAILLVRIAADAGNIPGQAAGAARSFRRDLGEGLHYMRTHLPVLEVTIGFLPGNFLLGMVGSFVVVYAATVFGSDPTVYGTLVAGIGAGTIVGALTVGRIRARRFAGLLMGVCVVAQGGAIALLVVARSLPVAFVGTVGFGITIGLINTVYYATMQAIVPNEVLARVLSIDSVGSFVAIPAGLIIGGLLSAAYGILFTFTVVAIGITVNGIVLLALPDVRALRYGG